VLAGTSKVQSSANLTKTVRLTSSYQVMNIEKK